MMKMGYYLMSCMIFFNKSLIATDQDSENFSRLCEACQKGNLELVRSLTKDTNVMMYMNSQDARWKNVLNILGNLNFKLKARKRIPIWKELLKPENFKGNLQNQSGKTPLHFAYLFSQFSEIMKLLLQNFSDVVNVQDKNGQTALHMVCGKQSRSVVESFLQYDNINVNLQDNNGDTVLHIASQNDFSDIVGLLLQHRKIDVNLQNTQGLTALHIACNNNHFETARLLLDYSTIDINLLDNEKQRAFDIASLHKYNNIVALFTERPNTDDLQMDPSEIAVTQKISELHITDSGNQDSEYFKQNGIPDDMILSEIFSNQCFINPNNQNVRVNQNVINKNNKNIDKKFSKTGKNKVVKAVGLKKFDLLNFNGR